MARRSIFGSLRRRGAVLCAVFAYVLFLNALGAAVFDRQAIAAALDPLAAAATCDSSGTSGSSAPHETRHQPDCTLCGPACSMAGSPQGLAGADGVAVVPPSALPGRPLAHAIGGFDPPSIYWSDTAAQAPPSLG